MREDVKKIISTLCKYKDGDIIAGAVCIDHVHLSVAIPPKYSISNFMGYLKGKSTLMIYDRHPELQSKWNKAFWGVVLSHYGVCLSLQIKQKIRRECMDICMKENLRCSKCGKVIERGMLYCPNCGMRTIGRDNKTAVKKIQMCKTLTSMFGYYTINKCISDNTIYTKK